MFQAELRIYVPMSRISSLIDLLCCIIVTLSLGGCTQGNVSLMETPQILYTLTLNLLTTAIVAPSSNASKWQMGFNSAFKGLNILHTHPYYRVCPDIPSLVCDPLSGNGCGPPNHTYS